MMRETSYRASFFLHAVSVVGALLVGSLAFEASELHASACQIPDLYDQFAPAFVDASQLHSRAMPVVSLPLSESASTAGSGWTMDGLLRRSEFEVY